MDLGGLINLTVGVGPGVRVERGVAVGGDDVNRHAKIKSASGMSRLSGLIF